MTFRYTTHNVCSTGIVFDVLEGEVRNVVFHSGCPGNLQGIARLVEGMPVEEAVRRLKGISCGGKPTSCPDQLARALEEYLRAYAQEENTPAAGVTVAAP